MRGPFCFSASGTADISWPSRSHSNVVTGQRMSVFAHAQLELDRPIDEVFARFVDFSTWRHWMPDAFAPVHGPKRALRPGDRVVVRMAGIALAPLRVLRVELDREVCWRGGIPFLLAGEHSFFFDDLGAGRTRIRSEEPFSGLLTRIAPVGKRIERDAGAVGASDAREPARVSGVSRALCSTGCACRHRVALEQLFGQRR
jgi:hypothetical protein